MVVNVRERYFIVGELLNVRRGMYHINVNKICTYFTQQDCAVSTANSSFPMMFNIDPKFIYDDGTTKWVNTGILSLYQDVDSDSIVDPPVDYDGQSVTMIGYTGYLCTKLACLPDSAPDYTPTAQYGVAPIHAVEYPTASGMKNYLALTEGSPDYCYYDSTNKKILVGFAEGGIPTDKRFEFFWQYISKHSNPDLPDALDGVLMTGDILDFPSEPNIAFVRSQF